MERWKEVVVVVAVGLAPTIATCCAVCGRLLPHVGSILHTIIREPDDSIEFLIETSDGIVAIRC